MTHVPGHNEPVDSPPMTAEDFKVWLARLQTGQQEEVGVGEAIPGLGLTDEESAFYKVYMGHRPSPPRGPAMHADVGGAKGPSDRGPAMHYDPPPATRPYPELRKPYEPDKVVGLGDALKQIYNEDTEKEFIELLLREGVITEGDFDIGEVHDWWEQAVKESAKLYKFSGRKVSPQDWIEMYAGVNGIGGNGSKAGPTTTTSKQIHTAHFDDLDARGLADDAYTEALGRRAKGREAEALQAALNAYAKAHPSVSKSTTTEDAKGNTVTRSTTRGGITGEGARQVAEDRARANPHYAEYQAATTYFNALQQALGATAEV